MATLIDHSSPILSLDSTYEYDEVREFDECVRRSTGRADVEYLVEPKIDGCCVVLRFCDGKLSQALTRGDGLHGHDVTQNVLAAVPSLANHLEGDVPQTLTVRAEIYMRKSELARLQAIGHKIKSARSAVAATLKMKRVDRRLDVYCFDIIASSNASPDTRREVLDELAMFGLPVHNYSDRALSIHDALQLCTQFDSIRHTLDCDYDGVVIKVNDTALCRSIGETTRAPRWAIAWKFSPETKEVTIQTIVQKTAKSGFVTPIATFQPVAFGTTLVSKVSLFNRGIVQRHGLCPGTKISVRLSGGVTPQVVLEESCA